MTEVPARVTVGCALVDVAVVDTHGDQLNGDKMGSHNGDASRVYIADNLSGHQLANTLLHEVMHAIWYTQGLCHDCLASNPAGLQEHVVNNMTNGLIQVIRDNPDLVKFLQKECKK